MGYQRVKISFYSVCNFTINDLLFSIDRGRVLSAPTKELKMTNEAKNTLHDVSH